MDKQERQSPKHLPHLLGEAGILHLNLLLNAIIDNVNILSCEQLSTVSACVLHKGHGKNKILADSYRTISSCQFLSKALDSYISLLYGSTWDQNRSAHSSRVQAVTMSLQQIHRSNTVFSSFIQPASICAIS